MNGWLIALLAVVMVFLLFYLFTLTVFLKMFRRPSQSSRDQAAFFERMSKSPLAGWIPEMKKGHAWMAQTLHEDVYIQSDDGLRLHGRFYPNESGNGKIFLLSHGFHSCAEGDFSCICAFYFSLGYHLLLIDQRAHGQSDGKYICFGTKEQYDLCNWCRYLEARFGKAAPIVISGVSMGSTVALLTAGLPDLSENVCGIIADCGFTSPYDEFRHVLHTWFHLPPFPVLMFADWICRHRAGFDLRSVTTLNAVKHIRVPVLFLHGEADNFVPTAFSRMNFDACTAPTKQLITVPQAGHGMSWLVDTERCRTALLQFLAQLPASQNETESVSEKSDESPAASVQ